MRTYRIYFIRHGLTDANKDGRYVGITDIPLCQEGKEALSELAKSYEYPNVGKVYISPLSRCRETADIIYPEMDKTVIEEIKEYNFGIYEDKTAAELKDDPIFRQWHATNMAQTPEGGENLIDFGGRIRQGMDTIIKDMMERKISDAAVVTHGGVIMTLLNLCGIPERPVAEWLVDNGKGYSVLVNAMLWSSSERFEICDKLPYGSAEVSTPQLYHFIDLETKEK